MTAGAGAPVVHGAGAPLPDEAAEIRWLRGRRPPARVFPAGLDGYRVCHRRMPSGERVRIVERGEPDAPPVVLVHGWGASAFAWRETIELLAAAGWRVVAPDLRGHGFSEKPHDERAYTSDAMIEHLFAIMDAAGVDRAPLVGHSLGGEIALGAALRAPERVSRLVLVAPVGFGHVMLARLGRLLTPRPLVRLLARLLGPGAVRLALRMASAQARWAPEIIEQHAAPLAHDGFAAATRHLLHGCLWKPRAAEELARVRVPTLVVCGTRDRLVPTRDAARHCRSMPEARLEWVAGAGHVLPEEASEQLHPLLLEFLEPARGPAEPAAAAAVRRAGP